MATDFARSDDPLLDRLLQAAGSQRIKGVDLSLDRIERLLTRLASPHRRLPPVFHVAGTNGKGSTCAFLRAGLEAAGYRVHVYTSPHLVRVNERIRLAGSLVSDAEFAESLGDVLRVNAGQPLSFFEAITAAAFLLFAATPADAVVLEVGLGGRLDATNVVPEPCVTGIAELSMDHVAILGPTIRHIAAEKAGIAKPGVPLLTQRYPPAVAARIAEVAALRSARLMPRGDAWNAALHEGKLHVRVGTRDAVSLPLPKLPGAHQADNLALAAAMLEAQEALAVPASALRSAALWAQWPARLQRIGEGPLFDELPAGSELYVDGGHNPSAGRAIAAWAGELGEGLPLVIILGLVETKDWEAYVKGLPAAARRIGVPVPGHRHWPPDLLAPEHAPDLEAALRMVRAPARVLVAGSLHLAGDFLRQNGPLPA
jgi:dihydrofolate synthase/folylpolyglutamate synthase